MFTSLSVPPSLDVRSFSSFYANFSIPSSERIEAIVAKAFQQLVTNFRSLDTYPNIYPNIYPSDTNVKTFAFISCLSLVTIFAISLFRRKDGSIVPPPTPFVK